MQEHFSRFPKFTSELVRYDSEIFFRQICDENRLKDQFTVSEGEMNLQEIEELV